MKFSAPTILAFVSLSAAQQQWSEAGCYVDGDAHLMAQMMGNGAGDQFLTAAKCQRLCGLSGYDYTGLKSGMECWCASELEGKKAGDGKCNTPCSGYPEEMCGGKGYMTVWSAKGPGDHGSDDDDEKTGGSGGNGGNGGKDDAKDDGKADDVEDGKDDVAEKPKGDAPKDTEDGKEAPQDEEKGNGNGAGNGNGKDTPDDVDDTDDKETPADGPKGGNGGGNGNNNNDNQDEDTQTTSATTATTMSTPTAAQTSADGSEESAEPTESASGDDEDSGAVRYSPVFAITAAAFGLLALI